MTSNQTKILVPADENFQVPALQPQHFNTWEDFVTKGVLPKDHHNNDLPH
jgi:hypothetical protein